MAAFAAARWSSCPRTYCGGRLVEGNPDASLTRDTVRSPLALKRRGCDSPVALGGRRGRYARWVNMQCVRCVMAFLLSLGLLGLATAVARRGLHSQPSYDGIEAVVVFRIA